MRQNTNRFSKWLASACLGASSPGIKPSRIFMAWTMLLHSRTLIKQHQIGWNKLLKKYYYNLQVCGCSSVHDLKYCCCRLESFLSAFYCLRVALWTFMVDCYRNPCGTKSSEWNFSGWVWNDSQVGEELITRKETSLDPGYHYLSQTYQRGNSRNISLLSDTKTKPTLPYVFYQKNNAS